MTESYAQLEGLWIGAGGAKSDAPLMAAIAEAESSGNEQAYNPIECAAGSHAEGLWQICMPLNKQYVPGGNAYNPQANAAGAVGIKKAQGLGAWATYTSGAYQQFMQGNVPPANAQGSTPSGGLNTVQASFNPLDPTTYLNAVPQVVGAKSWQDMLIRGGLVILGAVLVIVAVVVLFGKAAVQTAITVAAPEAKAGQLASGATKSAARSRTQAAAREAA